MRALIIKLFLLLAPLASVAAIATAHASSRLLIDSESIRSNILDWLVLPKYGAGFRYLKVKVGGEINSTDGTEPTHARSRKELDHPKNDSREVYPSPSLSHDPH